MFDSHIHTNHSVDSTQTIDEVCERAIQMGLLAVTISDHVDVCFAKKHGTYDTMKRCVEAVKGARKRYGDSIHILQGLELAEDQFDPALTERILSLCEYDVILGSVHTLYVDGVEDSYSRVNWSADAMEIGCVKAFFTAYLNALRDMIDRADIDVLCHLTCPLRYINGKYNRGLDENDFADQIDAILKAIIQKGIALEVNTSGLAASEKGTLPSEEIIRRYFGMGGRLITLGSDAHVPQNIAVGFDRVKNMLRSIGFTEYCYFEKRKPKFISL
ncbi:MAG: histidinol-phosphatase HisJ family protein [Clostridia bacterium]|nr:histidinol-phosphatase HisJ family protein [Clostridia bacterium]